MLLVATLFLVVGTAYVQDASAVSERNTCIKQGCKTPKKNCLKKFSDDFKMAKADCKAKKIEEMGDCASDKQCKEEAKLAFKQCKNEKKLTFTKSKAACNNGKPCAADGQCPSSTCAPARNELGACITGGGSCPSTSKCLGGPNNGASCTPATSTSDLLGDAQDSYPTSHDCANDPLASITDHIGGLPINFALTTGQIVRNGQIQLAATSEL